MVSKNKILDGLEARQNEDLESDISVSSVNTEDLSDLSGNPAVENVCLRKL